MHRLTDQLVSKFSASKYRPHLSGGETLMNRYMLDCRKAPSESNCSLTIAGTEEEVLDAATAHAAEKHGHENTPELRETLRGYLEPAEVSLA